MGAPAQKGVLGNDGVMFQGDAAGIVNFNPGSDGGGVVDPQVPRRPYLRRGIDIRPAPDTRPEAAKDPRPPGKKRPGRRFEEQTADNVPDQPPQPVAEGKDRLRIKVARLRCLEKFGHDIMGRLKIACRFIAAEPALPLEPAANKYQHPCPKEAISVCSWRQMHPVKEGAHLRRGRLHARSGVGQAGDAPPRHHEGR